MHTKIVSNIIAWCHVYRDRVTYYSLVSCLEIVSNIIAWCHVYRDCV